MTDVLMTRPDPADAPRWATGVSGSPGVGDLWVVSWDGADLGLVLIAAVRPGHVLIWPVTDTTLAASAPCFYLDADWLTTDLVAWPEAEAGMSTAVLNRRLGAALPDRTIAAIHVSVVDGESPDDVRLAEHRDDEEAAAALERVCVFAGQLCDIEWTAPVPGSAPIDVVWAKDHGVTALLLSDIVDGPLRTIRDIAAGKHILPADAARVLAGRFDASWTDVLTSIRGDEVAALNDPSRKASILDVSASLNISETEARAQAWQHALRAARQQPGTAAEKAAARVDQALEDLMSDNSR